MKKLLVSGLFVAAAFGVGSAPASAEPFGPCDGKVDVVCHQTPCQPDYPCSINICVVWAGKCVV